MPSAQTSCLRYQAERVAIAARSEAWDSPHRGPLRSRAMRARLSLRDRAASPKPPASRVLANRQRDRGAASRRGPACFAGARPTPQCRDALHAYGPPWRPVEWLRIVRVHTQRIHLQPASHWPSRANSRCRPRGGTQGLGRLPGADTTGSAYGRATVLPARGPFARARSSDKIGSPRQGRNHGPMISAEGGVS
jgi:hypothetical protein